MGVALRVAYAVATVATAAAGARDSRRALTASKPALMPLLAAQRAAVGQLSPEHGAALAAAWVGDVLLLPPGTTASATEERARLRRGAAAFAVQQALYLRRLTRDGARPTRRSGLAVAGWLGALAVLDARGSGGRPDPVVTGYGVLLGATAATALGSANASTRTGGVLFLASDSAILLRERLLRRRASRGAAEAFVLLSYATAQQLLADGWAG